MIIYRPLETSLFDINNMIHKRQQRPNNNFSYVMREERHKTEGGSDDENAQDRWKELLQQEDSDEDILSFNPHDFEFNEDEEDKEGEMNDPNKVKKKKEKLIQAFFNKTASNPVNQDLVNVYDHESLNDDEDLDNENLDDLDISEKYRNETLRLSGHGTSFPKTITFLQEKFKSPTNSSRSEGFSFGFQHGVQGPTNINLNSVLQNKRIKNSQSIQEKPNQRIFDNVYDEEKKAKFRKESQGSRNFNEIDFSENVKDLQMKKLMKYTNKQKSLMEKLNSPQAKNIQEEKGNKAFYMLKGLNDDLAKKTKQEKGKSFDYGDQINMMKFGERHKNII